MGVDRVGIDRAVDIALANGRAQRVRAVVIVHGGKIVYERYSPNDADGPAKIMPGYSIAKSITSALVGILVRDGRLAVQDLAPIPAWSTPGDSRQEVTVEHLLRMSSGLKWDTEGFTNRGDDQHRMLTSDDATAYIAEKELIYKPGDIFFYNSGNFILLDRIMADIVGSGHAFQEFMRSELLDKIGLTRLELKFDRQGTWLGSYAADTTARYFAKFGLLYLRDGVWNGERILPEGWVEYSRTPSPANPEYGAGWWLDLHRPGVFYAVGVRGQVITVDPAHDLTFVTLATDSLASLPVSEAILDAFSEGE